MGDWQSAGVPVTFAVSRPHPRPMNVLRFVRSLLAAILLSSAALAADAVGTWKWQITTPNGEMETTLKLAMKDGKLAGIYQNQFGETPIKDVSFKDDVVAF